MLVLKYLKIKLQKYKQSKAKQKLKLKTVLHQQGELNVERISNGQNRKNKVQDYDIWKFYIVFVIFFSGTNVIFDYVRTKHQNTIKRRRERSPSKNQLIFVIVKKLYLIRIQMNSKDLVVKNGAGFLNSKPQREYIILLQKVELIEINGWDESIRCVKPQVQLFFYFTVNIVTFDLFFYPSQTVEMESFDIC